MPSLYSQMRTAQFATLSGKAVNTMSNGRKKNIKIISSSLDDEGARMLVIPLLREPVLMQDVYQPDQVMKLLRISKPRFYELTDLKQRNPRSSCARSSSNGSRPCPRASGTASPASCPKISLHQQNPRKPERRFAASSRRP